MSQHPLIQQFVDDSIVVILRGLSPDEAIASGEAPIRAGIRLMEVPLNRPGALDAIRLLVQHVADRDDIHIGAGTVLTPEAAPHPKSAINALSSALHKKKIIFFHEKT